MTFIPYPDIVVCSASGRYRLEVRGEPCENLFRDRADFTYRLELDGAEVYRRTSDELPERALPDYPHEAWVHDAGWVVIRTHEWFFAALLLLSPRGEPVFSSRHTSVGDGDPPGFLGAEESGGWGSGGPTWDRGSFAYFFEAAARPFWGLCTSWGYRVVLDLERACLASLGDVPAAVVARAEQQWVLSTLGRATHALERDPAWLDRPVDDDDDAPWWVRIRPILTAARHSAWLPEPQAVPHLRALERVQADSGCWLQSWANVRERPFAAVARLSLLRLGVEPGWHPAYAFEDRTARTVATFGRVHQPSQAIRVGIDAWELLSVMGTPDYVERSFWDYDYWNDASSYSARVHLRDPGGRAPPRVASVSRIDPPEWRDRCRRDRVGEL